MSILTVDTPPVKTNLTTIGQVLLDLNIADASQQQTYYLGTLIAQASDFIVRYTNRNFALTTYIEQLAAPLTMSMTGAWYSSGTPRLVLAQTPVKTINYVKYKDTEIPNTDYVLEDAKAGFLWREDGWRTTSMYQGGIELQPSRFGRYEWEVSYVAGYNLPGEDQRDLPYDLERVCLDIIKFWSNEQNRPANIGRQQIGDTYIEYTGSNELNYGFPITIMDRLNGFVDQ